MKVYELFDLTECDQNFRVIHSKNNAVLFDSTISGDYMPDLLWFDVETMEAKDNVIILHVH